MLAIKKNCGFLTVKAGRSRITVASLLAGWQYIIRHLLYSSCANTTHCVVVNYRRQSPKLQLDHTSPWLLMRT